MPTAILSVSDKTGLVEFARGLQELGWELLASGGTAWLLRSQGITVTEVADYTGSPEVLGGRVKTLHPAIHAGLLARATEKDREELEKNGWQYIDLVAVNLYPFEQTIARENATYEEAIENIDIGGVALIRAAAKNHERVTLVCDPADYAPVLQELRTGGVSAELRKRLAIKGFALASGYDAAIAAYFGGAEIFSLQAYKLQALRYGENPHQQAAFYTYRPGSGMFGGRVLQGKELSYNNLLDLDAAWRAVLSFEKPTICIVKHLSPCGIASSDRLQDAYTAALASDPISAFGGIVAANRELDGDTARQMESLFIECVIAPGFSQESQNILAKKKNCRLVEAPDRAIYPPYELRSVLGGLLKQDLDLGDPPGTEWRVVSKRQPTPAEWAAMRFAWRACQHVKSNAIVFAIGESTVGIGGGQPNRVDSVRIAAQRAGARARGAVMASDAFFPFTDSIEIAADCGITAVIHPGGSIRDAEAIAAADAYGMAMVVTGVRHFRH